MSPLGFLSLYPWTRITSGTSNTQIVSMEVFVYNPFSQFFSALFPLESHVQDLVEHYINKRVSMGFPKYF